jgi:putative DNA primase/helicase
LPPNDDVADILLGETADDDGNAKCAYALFGSDFLYCDAYGWMYWSGTHWQSDEAEAKIDRALFAMLKQRRMAAVNAGKEALVKVTGGTSKRMRDCKVAFRSLVTVGVDEFDQSPDELNVANGVLNLRTGELSPHAPYRRFTYCSKIPYNQGAAADAWTAFIAEVVGGGESVIEYLQLAVGYSLTGHTSEECLWYVYGPSRSGKGIFTETLLTLLGSPLSVEVDFATFTAKREGDTQNFDLAPLKPTRLVITSESNRYEVLNAGKIKQLTGGNYIRAAYKHRDLFTYRPQFKAWLVSNQPVNADVDDDALWYRVKVLEFPNGHIGKEDKTLKARMRSPLVLQGVLRWAVDGAMKWYAAEQGLEHPNWVKLATREHRAELDYVQAWLDERCEEAASAWISNTTLYASYETWCKANGIQPKAIRGLTMSLKNKGFTIGEQRKVDGQNMKGVVGIALLVR